MESTHLMATMINFLFRMRFQTKAFQNIFSIFLDLKEKQFEVKTMGFSSNVSFNFCYEIESKWTFSSTK